MESCNNGNVGMEPHSCAGTSRGIEAKGSQELLLPDETHSQVQVDIAMSERADCKDVLDHCYFRTTDVKNADNEHLRLILQQSFAPAKHFSDDDGDNDQRSKVHRGKIEVDDLNDTDIPPMALSSHASPSPPGEEDEYAEEAKRSFEFDDSDGGNVSTDGKTSHEEATGIKYEMSSFCS